MSTLSLDAVVADVGNLPPLPEVVIEIMAALREGDPDPDTIGRCLARDQALAARTLRVANSSFYGLQSKVATIHDALIVLGIRAVQTMVMALGVMGRLRGLHVEGFDQRQFWLHNAGTAIAAKLIARQVRMNEDSAFTAGLLHDIGRLVLVARFPSHYRQVAEYQAGHDCTDLVAEQDVLGIDHALIGGALARRWNFAPEIVEAIEGHHFPEELGAGSLAGPVHLADIVAHVLEFGANQDNLVPPLSELAWNRLGFSWLEFKKLLADVDRQRNEADVFSQSA